MSDWFYDDKMLILSNSILCNNMLTKVPYVIANRIIMIDMANIMKSHMACMRMRKEARLDRSNIQ